MRPGQAQQQMRLIQTASKSTTMFLVCHQNFAEHRQTGPAVAKQHAVQWVLQMRCWVDSWEADSVWAKDYVVN